MNSLPRFGLLVRPLIRFVSPGRCVRERLVSTRRFLSADLTLSRTNEPNSETFARDLSLQSYDVKMTTFARRIGYHPKELPSLLTALTTKSFVDLFPSPETNFQYNGRLSLLGRSVILMFVQEHLYKMYPDLPGDALGDVSAALTDVDAMRALCKRLELADVVRASVEVSLDNPSKIVTEILSDVVLAVISALYCDRGANAVREFVGEFIVSDLDQRNLEEMAKLEHPKQMLCYILKTQGKPRPVSRLLEKTGDKNNHDPLFTVGIYSMNKLLAEGTGPSLAAAESKAVKTALVEGFWKDLQIAPLPSRQENFSSEENIEILEEDSITQT